MINGFFGSRRCSARARSCHGYHGGGEPHGAWSWSPCSARSPPHRSPRRLRPPSLQPRPRPRARSPTSSDTWALAGRSRLGRTDPDRLHQPGRRVDRRQLDADDGVDFAVQFINEQAGGIGGRPIEIVQCFIANTEEGPAVRPAVRQRRLDRRRDLWPDRDRYAGVLHAALAESKAVVHGVSSEPGRHHPARRRRAQRRCRLHPRAVRDVRPGARRRIGGADVFGGDPVRRGGRAGRRRSRRSASRSSAPSQERPTSPSRCSPPGRTPTS